MAPFDPYHNWLGIPPHEQPASFYRLLGLVLFESNPEVIAQAADRQSLHIGSFQNGPQGGYCGQLLGEIGQAAECLLNPQQKAAYDQHLQEALSARGERSVMSAPPPANSLGQPAMQQPMGMSAGGFGDFNGYGAPGAYGQQPQHDSAWSNGPLPPPGAFGQPAGEMAMPQFNLMPGSGSMPGSMPGSIPGSMPGSNIPQFPTGFGPPGPVMDNGMGGMMPQQPMQNFMPGPPSPMQAGQMQPSPMQLGPMQPGMMPQRPQAAPQMPQSRMPAPAPFPKAQRPIPVAPRAATSAAAAPMPAVQNAAAASPAPPQPPPAAPPRPADELESLASTPMRRRFAKRKRNQVPPELIVGGVLLAAGSLIFVIWLVANNGGAGQSGYDRIGDQTPPVTTAVDAASPDMKKALAAKDSAKLADSAKKDTATAAADKKSRSITTVADHPARPKKAQKGQPSVADDGDAPNHSNPPPLNIDNGGNAATPAPQEVHATGPPQTDDDDVMEKIIDGDNKK